MSLRIGIDIGGTFTDLVAIAADGRVTTHKIASTPHDYGEGIIAGLHALLADDGGMHASARCCTARRSGPTPCWRAGARAPR